MGSTWEPGNGSDYQGYVPLGLCILFGRERVELVLDTKRFLLEGFPGLWLHALGHLTLFF